MKKILSLLLVLSLVIAMASCGGGEKKEETKADDKKTEAKSEEKTEAKTEAKSEMKEEEKDGSGFVFNLGSDPKTLDPSLNSASDGGDIINNTFEGLVIDSKEEGLVLAGAEDISMSEDGTVYTIKLRKDAKWSDGKPVTAQDYVYSWLRVMSAEAASEYSFIMMPHIKNGEAYFKGEVGAEEVGVKALDDYTLEATLNYPLPYFKALLSFYTYMPVRKDVVEANPDTWFRNPETFICNGPFKLAEYKTGDSLKLVKNEEYYGAADVKIDWIQAEFIEEATTAHSAYLSGDIAVNGHIPSEEIPTLQAEDPYFTSAPRIGTYYYIFNMDKPELADVKVRKALSISIDRKAIVENITKGGQIPATGFIPGSLSDSQGKSYRTGGEEYGIDPNAAKVEEAKKLMAEAGFPDGKGFPKLTVYYNTSEGHKKIAEAVQEMWKTNLGIDVELANEEWAVFQDRRHNGDFEIARGGWIGDYADPMTMLDLWSSISGNNDAQWRSTEQPVVAPTDTKLNPENAPFDKMLKDSMTLEGAERDAKLREAEKYLAEQNIFIPVYYYTYAYLINEDIVEGVEKTTMGSWYFKNAEVVE